MRFQVYGWMLLAGLWVGDAWALEPQNGHGDALAHATGCVEEVAALAAAPEVSAERDAQVNAICEAEARQPRHDPGTQTALDQWHQANLAAIRRQVSELMVSPNPRDQLAAAMIAPGIEPPFPSAALEWTTEEATTAFATARRLGPNDRLVAWLEAVDCPRARGNSGCDPQAALARLQQLEPDNAAVWISALDQAVAQDDGAAIDRFLARAAAASRYEIPFGEIALLLFQTLRNVDSPTMPPRVAKALGLDFGLGRATNADDHAGIQAMAIASAVAVPAHQPLQKLCVGLDGKPALAARLSTCIDIYAHMAQDPLLISQSIALTSLARLTADSAAGAQWRERLRQMHWVRTQGAELMTAGVPEGYLLSVWREGEMTAIEGVLRAAGVATTPPPGWLPDDERARALITTGRPPPRG